MEFWMTCEKFGVTPAEACFNFGFNIEGVVSIALNTTRPNKVQVNVEMVKKEIQDKFWDEIIAEGLIKTRISYENRK